VLLLTAPLSEVPAEQRLLPRLLLLLLAVAGVALLDVRLGLLLVASCLGPVPHCRICPTVHSLRIRGGGGHHGPHVGRGPLVAGRRQLNSRQGGVGAVWFIDVSGLWNERMGKGVGMGIVKVLVSVHRDDRYLTASLQTMELKQLFKFLSALSNEKAVVRQWQFAEPGRLCFVCVGLPVDG